MKKYTLLVLLICMLFISGCGVSMIEYARYSIRPVLTGNATWTEYTADDYTVLGTVSATGRTNTVLGIVASGDDGQGLLWKAAQEKYGDSVSGIKDITTSYDYIAVLPPIYAAIETQYYGVAVSEVKE